jgi:hypothetical protein
MRLKWSAVARRWVHDWSGVTIEAARSHGFRGLPRLAPASNEAPAPLPRLRWRAPVVKLLVGATAAMAAAKAKRLAVARERRRQYFAAWYAANRERIAEKRKGVRAPAKAYSAANRDRKRAYDKAYRRANRERIAAYNRARPKREGRCPGGRLSMTSPDT